MYNIKQRSFKKTKLNLLLESPQSLFHTKDLVLLWGIKNKNTLYTSIKRYIKRGVLISIHKGFYSKLPLNQLDPIKLGISFLHSFAYLSTETILTHHGIISQSIPHISLISDRSKRFKINNNHYISRQMQDKFLFNDRGIIKKDGIGQATIERAVADMLYYNPHYHFDAPNLINWKKVKEIQKIIGFKA